MTASKPFMLVATIKTLWKEHPKNQGREYGGTSRDLREAKEWLQVNEWEPGDVTGISERFNRFMASEFDGWVDMDYPIWAFLKHYSRYAPPRTAEVKQSRPQPQTMSMVIFCTRCETNHRADESCPVKVA